MEKIQKGQSNLKNKQIKLIKVEDKLSDFRTYYKATLIKGSHIDQWIKIESPEINPHMQSQLIFNEIETDMKLGKGQSLIQVMLELLDIYMGKNKHQPFISQYT